MPDTMTTMPPPSYEDDQQWGNSRAKRLLQKFLADGTNTLSGREMGSKEVYSFDPEFASFPYKPHFAGRLARLRSEARKRIANNMTGPQPSEAEEKNGAKAKPTSS